MASCGNDKCECMHGSYRGRRHRQQLPYRRPFKAKVYETRGQGPSSKSGAKDSGWCSASIKTMAYGVQDVPNMTLVLGLGPLDFQTWCRDFRAWCYACHGPKCLNKALLPPTVQGRATATRTVRDIAACTSVLLEVASTRFC